MVGVNIIIFISPVNFLAGIYKIVIPLYLIIFNILELTYQNLLCAYEPIQTVIQVQPMKHLNLFSMMILIDDTPNRWLVQKEHERYLSHLKIYFNQNKYNLEKHFV